MTGKQYEERKALSESKRYIPFPRAAAAIPLLALFCLLLWRSAELAEGVRAGVHLFGRNILPTVFPFAILSAYFAALPLPRERENGCFRRLFRLPTSALLPFLIGLLAGFPLGAKVTCDGYRAGIYTKEEAERMLCFTNNTGLAFLVGSVGRGMRGCVRDGVILFAVQALVAVLIALILSAFSPRQGSRRVESRSLPPLSFPSFPSAVQGAVNASLSVAGFIAFFSGILAILRVTLPHTAYLAATALLEVGNACSALSGEALGLPLTAFAVCFSGISVFMQAAAMAAGTDLRLGRAFLTKLLSGFLGSALTALFLLLTT